MRISDWSSDVCSSDLQIDWKATARARKLISREYQDEKNQQLIVVLDTGRRMMAREPATAQGTRALAHFDHALDASLVVSYLRSEEHTSELQSLMRISYAVFCLKKKKKETL